MILQKHRPVNRLGGTVRGVTALGRKDAKRMRQFNFRKYCYVFLWLALVLTVGIVWFFGGKSGETPPEIPAESGLESSGGPSTTPLPADQTLTPPQETEELAGVWVPYMSLNTEEKTQEAFESNYKRIADSAKAKGINALFVHVRAFSDALYPSEYFPWSHVLTGEQGKDPGYDPLAFMVEYAHEQGMEFHAWINPLRVKTDQTPAALSGENPYSQLAADYPYYFMEYGGGVYLNPAHAYVRSLIADGAAEIVRGYQVDGIHFDDYFYPSQEEQLDSDSYALYVQNVETPLPLEEWRTANINAMVAEVYRKIKQENPEVSFGISPQGNIQNDENMGADVKAWCAVPGYLDYICPQLYYSFENAALGYVQALEEWMALPRHEGLEVYAGLALYKAGTDADDGTWLSSGDNIARQIDAAREARCAGVVLYSSDYLDREETGEEVKNAMAALTG